MQAFLGINLYFYMRLSRDFSVLTWPRINDAAAQGVSVSDLL